MLLYKLELRMADKKMKIDKAIRDMIIDCAKEASSSTVSKKYKREFSIEEEQPDDYTLIACIRSRDPINPTRTFSTVTRAVFRNDDYKNLVKDHLVNGLVFQVKPQSTENEKVITLSDTKIVSEIVSIFFDNPLPSEKKLVCDTADKIRQTVIDYINAKDAPRKTKSK